MYRTKEELEDFLEDLENIDVPKDFLEGYKEGYKDAVNDLTGHISAKMYKNNSEEDDN